MNRHRPREPWQTGREPDEDARRNPSSPRNEPDPGDRERQSSGSTADRFQQQRPRENTKRKGITNSVQNRRPSRPTRCGSDPRREVAGRKRRSPRPASSSTGTRSHDEHVRRHRLCPLDERRATSVASTDVDAHGRQPSPGDVWRSPIARAARRDFRPEKYQHELQRESHSRVVERADHDPGRGARA